MGLHKNKEKDKIFKLYADINQLWSYFCPYRCLLQVKKFPRGLPADYCLTWLFCVRFICRFTSGQLLIPYSSP